MKERFWPHLAMLGAAVIAVTAFTVPLAGQSGGPNRTQGIAAWTKIAEVLRHPRCLNCHQVSEPLQGNQPRPHVPRVARGPDNHGLPAMKCASCHGSANNLASGAPGAGDGHWQLAPVSMNWQGLSLRQLCEQLKDPKRNGGRDGKALIAHMDRPTADPLVMWGWEPGADRNPVPMPHSEFVALVKVWVASEQPCPR